VLKLMKRPANSDNVLARIKKWREICPQLVIRSTFHCRLPRRNRRRLRRAAALPA
jgi:ribosomal protein S12 methylthiotransferase